MKESKRFYNQFDKKLIEDFIHANPRIVAAIKFAKSVISKNPDSRVLDIGSGLGWSSYEVATTFPKSHVQGIDLSEVLVNRAKTFFSADNLSYSSVDVISDTFRINQKFDFIIMLDVYEHIPADRRSDFNRKLKDILTEKGTVLLTSPSESHQNYLRRHKPEELQPVDEDINETVLDQLAREIGGKLTLYRYKTIWNENDYIHAVIQKKDDQPEVSEDYGEGLFRIIPFWKRVYLVTRSLKHKELPYSSIIRKML